MSSSYGEKIKLSIFGQSHSAAIGMVIDGVPAGLKVDMDALQHFLERRAPGRHSYTTQRREADIPEFLSGIVDGYTCGAPISAIIRNQNTHSDDYNNIKDCPRPGHADYTAHVKYQGYEDVAGGGHFSGRLTAPLCIAGGLCKQWLEDKGIQIGAHIEWIENIDDSHFDLVAPCIDAIHSDFPVINKVRGEQMVEAIERAKEGGDSIGGVIECAVTGVPAGIGDPLFGGMESRISQIIYSIPAVKSIEFGLGYAAAFSKGSQNNDAFTIHNGKVETLTNNAGGILGGITTGMPIIFRASIKPTPSISLPQQSISLSTMEEKTLIINGRHDPCIVPRAVPVVEAAAAIAIFDAFMV